MNSAIRDQIRLALEDDSEVMTAGLDSDFDDENKQMNWELIKRDEKIFWGGLHKSKPLSREDLQLIRDANEIHMNDTDNVAGRHKEAVVLNEWLDKVLDGVRQEPTFDEEGKCLKCGSKVSFRRCNRYARVCR